MKRLIPLVLIFAVFSFSGWSDEIDSLSQIFLTGKGIKDTDKDTFADKISLCMIIPDNPNPYELALASDIAARVNLESLVVEI